MTKILSVLTEGSTLAVYVNNYLEFGAWKQSVVLNCFINQVLLLQKKQVSKLAHLLCSLTASLRKMTWTFWRELQNHLHNKVPLFLRRVPRTTKEGICRKRNSCPAQSTDSWKGHQRKTQVRIIYFGLQTMEEDKQYWYLLHRCICQEWKVWVLRVYRCDWNSERRSVVYFRF